MQAKEENMAKQNKLEILNDPDFISLVSKKNTISWILTVLELVLYFGFIYLIAYEKPFLAARISPATATTKGIPIAVGTIFVSWILTGIYIWWANKKYDAMIKQIKDKIGG
jgi:uncharacterized membrane protein (DUF485 family)